MDGEMVNLLEKIDPAYYKDFIYIYPQKNCMYAESKKDIYGNLEASLFF